MYRITVEKIIENENFDEQWKNYQAEFNLKYRHESIAPIREIPIKSLVVDLTDEEFKAVKKAVLEVM